MSLLLSAAPRKRLVVLGLDGLPLGLAHRLGAILPNLRRIVASATTVRAELPELSPVNWTSFFTAKGPETHHIFGFSHIDPRDYSLRITNSTDIACPTIFQKLGDKGIVTRFVNLPNTHPVQPLRGMGISGFVSPKLTGSVHPQFLKVKLEEIKYKLEADTTRGRSDLDYLLKELDLTLRSRLNALELLWNDESWDCFIQVFTETDRLFHFFMDAVTDQAHPLHLNCIQFLARWDDALGVVLTKFDALTGDKRLMIMADHGFTNLRTEVCCNTWLKKQGLLSLDAPPADEWDVSTISADTRAFALDPGRIYIHDNRFLKGNVTQEERANLLETIRSGLLSLTYQGDPVLKAVHEGSTLYPGAVSDQLPDLVCESNPGFDLKAKFDRTEIFGLHGRTGTHTVDGAIFADTMGACPERMRDIGCEILQYFDISTDS